MLQAEALGLAAHAMAGFDSDKARATFAIPATYDPVAAIAIGYPVTEYGAVDSALRTRDERPRSRKPLSEIVRQGTFDHATEFTK
jgi:nitroreductase